MRVYAMLPTVLATSAMLASLSAQEPRTMTIRPRTNVPSQVRALDLLSAAAPRAVIGVSTRAAATSRDTLGVLVSEIQSGSPAEKAGLEEGDRIESVNGVSLKLAAADIGDEEMSNVLSRRLTRELDKLEPGNEVNLRVYSNGQSKNVRIKTVSPEDLYATPAMRAAADRATIGLSVGLNGSARDSLGVFVMSVDDNGPAAKAGIAEGSRIASINGVDLRDHTGDRAGDNVRDFTSSSVSKLERELSKVKPGDDVDLRVVYNGQSRALKVKSVRAADLPQRARSVMIMGGNGGMGGMMLPEIAGRLRELDTQRIGDEVRRAMDGVAGGITNIRAFARAGTVRW